MGGCIFAGTFHLQAGKIYIGGVRVDLTGIYPPEITETITLYYWVQDPDTRHLPANQHLFKCERAILENVYWNDSSMLVMQQTGAQVAISAQIYIPSFKEATGRDYLRPTELYAQPRDEIPKFWTVDPQRVNNTRLVRGVHEFEFAWLPAAQFSQEFSRAFVGQGVNVPPLVPGAIQPRTVSPQLIGTPELRHVQIHI
jgi:hypothetical protein